MRANAVGENISRELRPNLSSDKVYKRMHLNTRGVSGDAREGGSSAQIHDDCIQCCQRSHSGDNSAARVSTVPNFKRQLIQCTPSPSKRDNSQTVANKVENPTET